MAATFTCPHCRKSYKTSGKSIGKRVKCKQCATVFTATADNVSPKEEPEHDTARNPSIRVDDAPSEKTAAEDNTVPEYNIDDAKSLWQDAVDSDQSDGMSIKSEKKTQAFSAGATASIPSRSITRQVKGQASSDDFELVKVIGKGGMGAIFSARQASMDRDIAVKMILPEQAGSEKTKSKFISEALVTGELDHPNIVPVYELGKAPDGTLFYAMKEVKGISWKDAIEEKSEAENLQILMSVCDAMAFAHDHGVVHRDLKPENIMLGDYGEVLVMDWGLAVCTEEGGKAEPITGRMSKAGTPAYMAPEMATCEGARIGTWSDIYLLGGILYEIATGLKPHTGEGGIYACICQAMENVIQETDQEGELIDIALTAMATQPRARYASVKEFQTAIREYQSHLESIVLCQKAEEDLASARRKKNYDIYAQSVFGFRQAWEMWEENSAAKKGLRAAQQAYAELALKKGDLDLAASQLDSSIRKHRKLAGEVKEAQTQRRGRQKRIKLLTYGSGALACALAVVFAVAFFWIQGKEAEARRARDRMEIARQEAVDANAAEVEQRKLAETAKATAVKERELAVAAQQEAEAERQKATRNLARAHLDRARLEMGEGNYREAWARVAGSLKLADTLAGRWTLAETRSFDIPLFARIQYMDCVGLAFSPDNRKLAAAAATGTVRVYSLAARKQIWIKKLDKQRTSAVVFRPAGGSELAVCCNDGTVKLMDSDSDRMVRSFPAHEGRVYAADFSPDGRLLVSAGHDRLISLFEVDTGKLLRKISGHRREVTAIRFNPRRDLIVSASEDRTIRVWEASTGQMKHTLVESKGKIWTLAVSPDGKKIASGDETGSINIWDVTTGRLEKTYYGHGGAATALTYSPDGATLYSTSMDRTVRLWDSTTGKSLKRLTCHNNWIWSLARSLDGKILASGDRNGAILIWKLGGASRSLTLRGHRAGVTCARFSPDGTTVCSGAVDGTVKLWSMAEGRPLSVPGQNLNIIDAVAYHPKGTLIAAAGAAKTVWLWETATGREVRKLGPLRGGVVSLAFNADGSILATGTTQGECQLWATASGNQIASLTGLQREVAGLVFNPDGQKLCTVGYDGMVRVWNVKSRKLLWKRNAGMGTVRCAAWSSDGERLVVGGFERGSVKLYNPETGEETMALRGHTDRVQAAAFHNDNVTLVTGGYDRTIRVWDTRTGESLAVLRGHQGEIRSLQFSPDGMWLLSGSIDRTIRLWDLTALKKPVSTLLEEADKRTGLQLKGVRLVPSARKR